MMRSLWTAASGMTSQQLNVDNISNNIANVNTTGYKRERLEFKSLLYQTMERATLDDNGMGRPVNLQVGHGVRPIVSSRIFSNGSFERTDNPSDFYLQGKGFFIVDRGNGDIVYTKDGSFKLSIGDGETSVVTSEGYSILDIDGEPITLPENLSMDDVTVDEEGNITYIDEDGEVQDTGSRFGVVQFTNVQGLEAIGNNFYRVTPASGEPIPEADGDTPTVSRVIQSVLEMSNVNVAEEMVNLIIAQRAYELNSKAIQTSDDMLQQASTLKR